MPCTQAPISDTLVNTNSGIPPDSSELANIRDSVAYAHLQVQPLTPAIGAEIHGVSLDQNLSPEVVAEIRQALLQPLVIVFRDQDLTTEQYLAFSRQFGPPKAYPFLKGLDGFPEVHVVSKLENEQINFGGLWHSDTSYLERPPMLTMLYALEVPELGGDTLFANQYLAYETLSKPYQQFLSGLKGVNIAGNPAAVATRVARIKDAGTGKREDELEAVHPVIRTHPETGRKALYVNCAHTAKFEGMTAEESKPILQYLHQHQTHPEFCCRLGWGKGSLTVWDNRCAQHNAINDYHGQRRVMHRINLQGDRPS